MKKTDFKGNFRIPVQLGRIDDVTENRRYQPWLPSPPKLVKYAGDVVKDIPMPSSWNWTIEDVVQWLENTVALPQYKDCIRRNFINGRRLLLLETFGFEKIGIRDFSDIQKIASEVRKVFGIERPKADRSIGLPPRYPWTHYLIYRAPTGPSRENTTPFELLKKMGILDEAEPYSFGHWEMIEPTFPSFPCNRFGHVRRKDVYHRNEHPRQPRGHSFLKRSKEIPNYFARIDIK